MCDGLLFLGGRAVTSDMVRGRTLEASSPSAWWGMSGRGRLLTIALRRPTTRQSQQARASESFGGAGVHAGSRGDKSNESCKEAKSRRDLKLCDGKEERKSEFSVFFSPLKVDYELGVGGEAQRTYDTLLRSTQGTQGADSRATFGEWQGDWRGPASEGPLATLRAPTSCMHDVAPEG
jgi:hypothetical protein